MIKRILNYIARSRAKSALHSMTDRQLRDIGIYRGEINRRIDNDTFL